MFLLIRRARSGTIKPAFYFTFHNVSINTVTRLPGYHAVKSTLHSTMFLLIQMWSYHNRLQVHIFTFHNVSINTRIKHLIRCKDRSLHSTMFLLIPVRSYPLYSECTLYIPQCFY